VFAISLSISALFIALKVARAIVHASAQQIQQNSNCFRDIEILPIFKLAAAAYTSFYWLMGPGEDALSCQISSKSVNPLRRYCDFSFFYCATLCKARYMPSSCVCVSLCVCVCVCVCVWVCVCVSVTLRYCIKTAKRRITQIMPQDRSGTLVYTNKRVARSLCHSRASCLR